MNIPLKPWEVSNFGAAPTGMSSPYIPNTNITDNRLYSSAVPFPGSSGGVNMNNTPNPPLPPRPGQQNTLPIYSASASYNRPPMYNPYNPGLYGATAPGGYYNSYGNSYSPMGLYGGQPRPMFGAPGYNELTFSQLAEESSAGAFQSIESFVSAFGSISAMLESTFQAVYSSFRAVVGVADHLGRVKQVFSALAIFRFIRWSYRRILYLIGLSKIKPEQIESLWNSASNEIDGGDWTECQLRPARKPSSWPILMFLGFIFAGPYLMWKLLASLNLNTSAATDTKWASGESEHFIASAEYDFESVASDRELKMKKGQRIRLAPSAQQPPNVKGWVLASDGVKIGLVPTNYIKILGKRAANPVPLRVTNVITSTFNNSNTHLNSSNYMQNSNLMSTSASSASDTETLKASRSSSTSSLFTSPSPQKSSKSKQSQSHQSLSDTESDRTVRK